MVEYNEINKLIKRKIKEDIQTQRIPNSQNYRRKSTKKETK